MKIIKKKIKKEDAYGGGKRQLYIKEDEVDNFYRMTQAYFPIGMTHESEAHENINEVIVVLFWPCEPYIDTSFSFIYVSKSSLCIPMLV